MAIAILFCWEQLWPPFLLPGIDPEAGHTGCRELHKWLPELRCLILSNSFMILLTFILIGV